MKGCGNVCEQRDREKVEGHKRLDEREGSWGKNNNRGRFQCETREEGGWIAEEDQKGEEKSRASKDKRVNKKGKILIEFMGKRGCVIFNGNIKGDDKGEYTYTGGRGESVIDYIVGDGRIKDRIERIEVEERVKSDHQPIVAWIRGRIRRERRRKENRQIISRGVWNEEGRKEFIEKIR